MIPLFASSNRNKQIYFVLFLVLTPVQHRNDSECSNDTYVRKCDPLWTEHSSQWKLRVWWNDDGAHPKYSNPWCNFPNFLKQFSEVALLRLQQLALALEALDAIP